MIDLAERAVLATLLHKPDLAAKAFSRVPVERYTGPNKLLAEAIQGLRVARKPVEPGTVFEEMTRRGTISRVGPAFPHEVYAEYVTAESLDYHLDVLADNWRKGRLHEIGATLTHAVEQADVTSDALALHAAEQIQGVIDHAEADQDINTPTLREFLAGDDDPHDWVIPGLLERGDRFVLTGVEGLGKSVLFRQLAVAAASGLHPFTQKPVTPQRVLYVDAENGRTKLRRAMRGLVDAARQASADPGDNLWIECRPEGLDLTRPEDETWLVSRVSALQPSILVTGPIYRLHTKNPNDEEPARRVAAVLDRCRAAANCALVLEAHAGHGPDGTGKRAVRPTGTSLWLRWPEFGYGIRPSDDFTEQNRVVEFLPWRGDRDERKWPKRLRAGGAWPWAVATDPNETWPPSLDRSA